MFVHVSARTPNPRRSDGNPLAPTVERICTIAASGNRIETIRENRQPKGKELMSRKEDEGRGKKVKERKTREWLEKQVQEREPIAFANAAFLSRSNGEVEVRGSAR